MKIWIEDFKGKRRLKDCGCGMADDDTGYAVVAVSMPIETRQKVNRYRHEQGLSFSRALVELVRIALDKEKGKEKR